MTDRVHNIIEEWSGRRPDLDTSAFAVVSRVLRAAHHLQAALDRIAAAYGLSHQGDLDALMELYRADPERGLTPTELANASLLTAGGMTVRLQRAENTWETNADNVAEAVRVLADQVEARLILVAGPTRAQSMVARSIADTITTRVVCVDAGDLDGIAAEVLRYTADVAARDSKALIAKAREAQGTGQAPTSTEQLLEALDLGQVDTLLVHDAADTTFGPEPRLIDRCIKQALLTDSDIHVVPNVDILNNGAAALLRWQPETGN